MSTKVKTEKVRFGHVHVFEPRKNSDEVEPKYSAQIIIDKDDKKTLNRIKEAIEAAKELGKDKCWRGKIPSGLKLPLRSGDTDKPESPELEGKYFLNARANLKYKPQVVKIEGGRIEYLTDPQDFQSGDYGKAVISFFPYSFSGSNGIGVGLNNILFTEKGESLIGATSAVQDFSDEIGEDDDTDWLNGE